jgi:hypothetical protein
MNKKTAVKLIKKAQLDTPAPLVENNPAAESREWSKAVRTWISESQENNREESLAAFDNLFK